MVIVFKQGAPEAEKEKIKRQLINKNFKINEIIGQNLTIFGVIGDTSTIDPRQIMVNDWVEKVMRVQEPFKLANRMFHPEDTIVDVAGVKVGGGNFVVIAGPCSIETQEQMDTVAAAVKASGARLLRGGAFKPRTSPYSFQGLGDKGLDMLREAGRKNHLPIVTEIMSADKIEEFVEKVDLFQVGARNMQNFDLLKAVGRTKKPVLLKRGMSATIEEWIMSAEYIMSEGNPNVIFCERGIRTFEKYTRNTMDLAVVPIIHEKTHLPIVIDPSHATGDWKLVKPVSLAAIAAGADGLIIECHNHPECALSDGMQSLKPNHFGDLVREGRAVARAIGRDL